MKTHSVAPVFRITDLDAAMKYYVEILGFKEEFRFGLYAGVTLGEFKFHLCQHEVHSRPIGGGTAYIICDEVDSYYAGIKAKGALVQGEPKDYSYGLRDFIVVDPDGNQLSFGCESKTCPPGQD